MKPRSFEIDRRQIREMLSHPIPDANGRDTREVRDTQHQKHALYRASLTYKLTLADRLGNQQGHTGGRYSQLLQICDGTGIGTRREAARRLQPWPRTLWLPAARSTRSQNTRNDSQLVS